MGLFNRKRFFAGYVHATEWEDLTEEQKDIVRENLRRAFDV